MKFERVEYEGVIESHIKIFMYLAGKYINSLTGFEVQDLIHEQKIACYQAMERYDTSKPVGSFLYAVAENKLKSMYRFESRKKRKPKQLLYLENGRFEQAGLLLKNQEPTPEDKYYVSEVKRKAAIVAMDILSDFEYQLYVAIVEDGKTVSQIAAGLGKSETQVNNGISRMRKKMREKRELIYTEI